MSRALQSLTSTTPKTWSRNADALDRLAEPAPRAHDEAELELDVESSARPEARRLVCRRLRLARRAHDRRPADDDGAGAAVVPDRQVPPVRQQRIGVGPEETAEVRRVLERGVEVDVVARPRRAARSSASSSGTNSAPRGDQLADPDDRVLPRRPAEREERVEARRLEDLAQPARSEIEDPVTDAEPNPRRVAPDGEDAESDPARHARRIPIAVDLRRVTLKAALPLSD